MTVALNHGLISILSADRQFAEGALVLWQRPRLLPLLNPPLTKLNATINAYGCTYAGSLRVYREGLAYSFHLYYESRQFKLDSDAAQLNASNRDVVKKQKTDAWEAFVPLDHVTADEAIMLIEQEDCLPVESPQLIAERVNRAIDDHNSTEPPPVTKIMDEIDFDEILVDTYTDGDAASLPLGAFIPEALIVAVRRRHPNAELLFALIEPDDVVCQGRENFVYDYKRAIMFAYGVAR